MLQELCGYSAAKVPFHVIQGQRDGPKVIITAGIHGTEIAGIYAARYIIHKIQITKGTLIVFPVINALAFRQRTRGKPDLNRTFPRSVKERPKHQISRDVFRNVAKFNPAWCIDLHEANGFYKQDCSKLGQTLIVYPNKITKFVAEQTVKSVNRIISNPVQQFSVLQSVLPGSFRTATGSVLGCHAITVETSMFQPLRRRVQYQLRIIHQLLERIGLNEQI